VKYGKILSKRFIACAMPNTQILASFYFEKTQEYLNPLSALNNKELHYFRSFCEGRKRRLKNTGKGN
jgi:hypothetical protein